MNEYTAEDGLSVLNFLGITNITDEEIGVFEEKWKEFYKARDQNLVMATWTLYASALPYICSNDDSRSFMVAKLRDSDFDKRLKETDLYEKLKSGIPLKEIIKN